MSHPTAHPIHRTSVLLTSVLLAGALALTGCSDDAPGTGPAAGSPPGATAGSAVDHNAIDVSFAAGMRIHHQGAIEMAQLAPDRAADPRVLDLAGRIEAAQAPEIDTLTGWLSHWGAEGGVGSMPHGSMTHGSMTHGSMAHGSMDGGSMAHGSMDGGMTGEMSAAETTALTDASGAEFDRLFLSWMIAHHRGATQMAEQEAAGGQDADAIALAEHIRDTQAAEIAEMQALLAELGD
ncbi:DUF305 domain-containing protein [Modestobacter sp. SYSU DS0875]